MGKGDLPYVHSIRSKGCIYHYYRRDGERIRIIGDPGSDTFLDNYSRIHRSFQDSSPLITAAPGSLAWLVWLYRNSPEFKTLSDKTRKDYIWYFSRWCVGITDADGTITEAGYGDLQVPKITKKFLYAWRDAHQDTPSQTNYSMRVLKLLFSWGVRRDYILANPIKDVEPLKKTGDGWKPWSDDDIAQVKAVAPDAVCAVIDMAQYTGQRREDLCLMTWDDIEGGGIWVTQKKTHIKVWIPLHPILRDHLDLIRKNNHSKTILATAQGLVWKPDYMTHQIKFWCRKAGIEHLNLHGLRKTASVRMAECGCTEEQIKSITGHRTNAMVAHYVRGSNQKRLAQEAMRKILDSDKRSEIHP